MFVACFRVMVAHLEPNIENVSEVVAVNIIAQLKLPFGKAKKRRYLQIMMLMYHAKKSFKTPFI